jgi:predicted metalloendopeptidase
MIIFLSIILCGTISIVEGATEAATTTTSAVQLYCSPCLSDDKGYSGIDPSNFDQKVSPKENFYLWSNGTWKENNPIPLEYSSWNTFIALRDLNLERLMELLNELSSVSKDSSTDTNGIDIMSTSVATTAASTALNTNTMKLADYYNTFMNEELIESKGITVLFNVD